MKVTPRGSGGQGVMKSDMWVVICSDLVQCVVIMMHEVFSAPLSLCRARTTSLVRLLKDNGRAKIQGEKLQSEIDLFSLLHIPVNKPTPSYHS
jgi:hypothetical protein